LLIILDYDPHFCSNQNDATVSDKGVKEIIQKMMANDNAPAILINTCVSDGKEESTDLEKIIDQL
jgi:hypothetical protein